MLDKDTIEKLRKKAGNEALGLITALESLEEAANTIEETNDRIKKISAEIEFINTDIKIAKNKIMSHIKFIISDDI